MKYYDAKGASWLSSKTVAEDHAKLLDGWYGEAKVYNVGLRVIKVTPPHLPGNIS